MPKREKIPETLLAARPQALVAYRELMIRKRRGEPLKGDASRLKAARTLLRRSGGIPRVAYDPARPVRRARCRVRDAAPIMGAATRVARRGNRAGRWFGVEELHAALAAATQSLRAAEALAQTLAKSAATAGVHMADAALADELSELRQAAGDVHRAVAVLLAGTTAREA
jgi:hypothetical protein